MATIFTTNLIQNKITITHSRYNEFSFPLSVSHISTTPIADGNIIFVESKDPGGNGKKCAVDISNKLLFFTTTGSTSPLRSYTYTTGAALTIANSYTPGGSTSMFQVCLDITTSPRLVFAAHETSGIRCFSYTSVGVLTLKSTRATTHASGCVVDTGKNFVFVGELHVNGAGIESYSYTDAGVIGAQIDATAADLMKYNHLAIDTDYQIVFAARSDSVAGLISCIYDNSANLTLKTAANTFEHTGGVAVDTTNKLVFGASNTGLHVYSYDSNGAFTLKDSIAGTIANGVQLDTTSKIVFVAFGNDGGYTYKYTTSGLLTPVNNDDQGGDYDGAGIDTTNWIAFFCAGTSGVHTYTYS